MLEFPIEFFDDEVRDGFYVPSIMKHNWAAQMEVLSVVDEICKKNNIKYYLFSGSLIGAIRHGGFIPWDDDMDICMLRKDYMRFVKVIMRDKPERYYIRNCHTDPTYRDVFTRLMNDSDVAMAPEFFEKGHGFVCSAGIDVFPLDYIPSNPKKREEITGYLMHLCYVNKKYDEDGLTQELEGKLLAIENTFKVKIVRDETIPQQLYKLMEDILCGISRGESRAVQISLDWAQSSMAGIPIECFKEAVQVPFEVTTYSAPYLYDKLLSSMFGNYMKCVRICKIHDYPWYGKILDDIQKFNGLSDYMFRKELLPEKNRRQKWEQGLRSELNEYISIINEAGALAEKCFNSGDVESGNVLLEKCKSLAENAETIEKKLNGNGRDRVIFFTWKAQYWDSFEPYYLSEVEAGNEVFVIPMPYIRLTEARRHTGEYLETEGFPSYVELTSFNDFNYSDGRINRMYIQFPYDDANGASLTRPFFNTESLRKYTDELIYIPWFELDEYGTDDVRAMYMMKFFARIPGMVTVDKVYLSENQAWLKDIYVYDLVDWAGEDTRQIWEEKIQVVSFVNDEQSNASEKGLIDSVESDKQQQKTLFYYIGTGQILADAEQMIEKLKKNYDVFEESQGKIKVKLFIECGLKESLARLEPKHIRDFNEVCDKYRKSGWCEVIDADVPVDVNNREMMDNLINGADAFYGDGGVIMHMFSRAKKPVMMQNVAI